MAQTTPSPRPSSDPAHPDPGDPVADLPGRQHDGVAPAQDGAIRVVVRAGSGVREAVGLAAIPRPIPADTAVWIDATGLSAGQVAEITEVLDLHELIAEDILEGNQRSKIELTEDRIHIVMFALEYGDPVGLSEIDFVLGKGFLLTVHDRAWDPRAIHHFRGDGLAAILRRGPDHLLWALCDDLVDGYFPLMDKLGDEIDLIQDAVMEKGDPQTLERLFMLKRELIAIRRAAAPVREIFNQLTNRDLALVDEEEILYFRDVYDHLIRLTDELDTYRELVSGTLDVYLSTVNNNLSLIMKRLTGVTVVLAGIGALAGIFGMSEAGAAFAGTEAIGFWLVTATIVAIAFALAYVLRRIDWI
jgi:magnesium transporter